MSESKARWFKRGDMLTPEEIKQYVPDGYGRWFTSELGQKVYVCDGSHRDGARGFKVLDLDGLK